jgi:HAD superfamily hydrolase (TIGR01490 family)
VNTAEPASGARVAAFFDLDGTLVARPSLERRMFRALLYRRAIAAGNLAWWAAEFVRLAPRGIEYARFANKMYLRGVSAEAASSIAQRVAGAAHLQFFSEAVERVAWHAARGHRVVLVSGTLELLASQAARSLESVLARRGATATILVYATRLEEIGGRWTGRVAGAPMFGAAKAETIRSLALRRTWDLDDCFAYGDSVQDRAMLECVGHAIAVNASLAMRRVAVREGWRVVEWREGGASLKVRRDERIVAQTEAHDGAALTERNVETWG